MSSAVNDVSVRMRSAVGSILVAAGLVLGLLGMLVPGLVWTFYAGLIVGATGLLLLVDAMRATAREIGNSQARFDAQLRSEIDGKKEPKG